MYSRLTLYAAFASAAPWSRPFTGRISSLSSLQRCLTPSVLQQPLRRLPRLPFSSIPNAPQMALPSADTVSSASFMESVEHAQTILRDTSTGVSDAQLALISTMLRTSNGARGLFVTLLSDERVSLADRELPDKIVDTLTLPEGTEKQRETVRILIAKNVLMASTMVVHYRRSDEEEKRMGSELTRDRGKRVAKACVEKDEELRTVLGEMLTGAEEGQGQFVGFLQKWGYDDEQKEAGARSLREVLGM